MDYTHFTRIEREMAGEGSRHFVIHSRDPKLAIEIAPDVGAPDKIGHGVIRRVTVPNSWAGQYSQYAHLIAQAQAFFRASFAEPAGKSAGRLGR